MRSATRFTSLRSTPGSFRVTFSTDALHAAQCIPEMSYTSSRIGGLLLSVKMLFCQLSQISRFLFRLSLYTPTGYLSRGSSQKFSCRSDLLPFAQVMADICTVKINKSHK